MEALDTLELFDEVSLLFHKSSFLFGPVCLHLCTNFLEMLFTENIFLLEKILNFFSSSQLTLSEIFFLPTSLAASSASSLIARDGAHTGGDIFFEYVLNFWFPIRLQSILILLWLSKVNRALVFEIASIPVLFSDCWSFLLRLSGLHRRAHVNCCFHIHKNFKLNYNII